LFDCHTITWIGRYRNRVAVRGSKGIRFDREKAHELMREDLVLVVLGTGERKYEDFFKALAAAYRPRGREDRL